MNYLFLPNYLFYPISQRCSLNHIDNIVILWDQNMSKSLSLW